MRHVFLFLILFLTYSYFYQSTQQNEAARFDQARAIVEEHRLAIDSFSWNTADSTIVTLNGETHVYPAKAPGSAFLAAIPLFILSPLSIFWQLPDWFWWHIVAYVITVLMVCFPSALAAVLMSDVVFSIIENRNLSIVAVLGIWLGTILFPFSTLYFGHGQTAAALVGSFWIIFKIKHFGLRSFRHPDAALFVSGVLAGVAVLIEYQAVIVAAPLLLYCAAVGRGHNRWSLVPIFLIGAGLMGAILATYNWVVFGKIFYSAYQSLGQTQSQFPALSVGIAGVHWPGWRSFVQVLDEILIKPQRGLLYVNPVLWLVIPGFILWFRRSIFRVELWFVLAITVVYIIFNACYGDSIIYWGGGASVGPRQIVPMLPFLAIPLAFAARYLKLFFYPLLVISVIIMLLATAVEPRVPYIYNNPVFDFFLPSFLAGRFGQNTEALFDPVRHGLIGSSTAVNFGGALGLSGVWQLVPLVFVWILLVPYCLRSENVEKS